MALASRDRRHLGRAGDPEPLEIARSDGAFVFDRRGKRYIDFVMGWCVGNFGWNNREIAESMARQRFRGPDYAYPEYLYAPWAELAERLAALVPRRLSKVFRATGGTEAVEVAIQAAMVSTGRRRFVSIEGSYHGDSIGAMSIGASEYRETFPNLLAGCRKISPPLDSRAAEKVRRLLKGRDVAAFIMEPIVINLGVQVPTTEFMRSLRELCTRYGTVLIFDEVATGFGRTGRLFAFEHFHVTPDVLCLAKAITGGVQGMGATLTTPAIARAMSEDSSYYSTYGWHPRAVQAALATLAYVKKHRTKLLANAVAMEEYFAGRLASIPFRHTPTVRAKGVAIGLEFEDEDYAEELVDRCRDNGLLVADNGGGMITLFPPLTIDRETAAAGLDILERSA
jgi:acetylornithine/succinyldiaminopimelate/putrescine aminotransferase